MINFEDPPTPPANVTVPARGLLGDLADVYAMPPVKSWEMLLEHLYTVHGVRRLMARVAGRSTRSFCSRAWPTSCTSSWLRSSSDRPTGIALGVLLIGSVCGRLPEQLRALVLGLGAGCGFGVVEVTVRLIDDLSPPVLLTNPAAYALLLGGGSAFLLLTSALQRGSVTTATAGLVLGETIGPALVGVVWLGDRTREGLGWLAVVGFVVAVAGALALVRFGEAPQDTPEPV